MPTTIRRTAITLGIAAVAVATFVHAQNLRLHTGEWDFTMTGLGGVLGAAADLPPAARARLAQPHHYKSCITSEDLAQLSLVPPDDEDEDKDESCKVTSNKVTGQTADITRTCTGEKARTEKIRVEASSPENLKATIDITSARGSAQLNIVGKWIGATCTDSD